MAGRAPRSERGLPQPIRVGDESADTARVALPRSLEWTSRSPPDGPPRDRGDDPLGDGRIAVP